MHFDEKQTAWVGGGRIGVAKGGGGMRGRGGRQMRGRRGESTCWRHQGKGEWVFREKSSWASNHQLPRGTG